MPAGRAADWRRSRTLPSAYPPGVGLGRDFPGFGGVPQPVGHGVAEQILRRTTPVEARFFYFPETVLEFFSLLRRKEKR
ncbi:MULTISPECIES: hypothetical protein [Arthrobacter]|uniref:Uncharacterized protein n=1 Tax=Arthrobacter terricola TaxID=2547396 RepID=A0A4R5KA71_9MICC|nr:MULTISPECIES: hypothetical protein [Arthrobacter]MBT8162854.1 hypothetical protein [Arthrobacter sp. GN70]TDF91916.1 hypothetical protein E1809_19460 [Arthrobacter terricola]